MHHKAQTGHLGGALSMVDILLAVHGEGRVIVSKGHAISAWYAVLYEKGRQGVAQQLGFSLADFNRHGSNLPEQPAPDSYGVEWATGSLGHGLSVGLGFALADKLKGNDTRTFVILSDGECQEGSVWEAAMLAPVLGLTNLTVIVDANDFQATGKTIVNNHWLSHKFDAFGWHTQDTPPSQLDGAVYVASCPIVRPTAIIAHTVKGAGIPFIEANQKNDWHYRAPSAEDVERARIELGQP